MRLEGKKILITGGGQGIGRACAARFAEEGATVVIADINLESANESATGLAGKHYAVSVDVADEEKVKRMVEETVGLVGRIDVVVHCAGVTRSVLNVLEMPYADFKRVLDLNVNGTFLVCREVGRVMASQKSGIIITLGSTAGSVAQQGGTPYGAAKAAVEHLTRIVAMDLAPFGIRVNAVSPGPTRGPMVATHSAERQARYIARIAAGRQAHPREIANVALFLASDESSFMTGAVVAVDGGYTVGGLKEVLTETPFSFPSNMAD